ncbi:MAG: hypothetical protein JWM43_3516 [Acidobacteriaceae bacterium]|nr:hypothetical protein [Acidobacteriaceae bacterium]
MFRGISRQSSSQIVLRFASLLGLPVLLLIVCLGLRLGLLDPVVGAHVEPEAKDSIRAPKPSADPCMATLRTISGDASPESVTNGRLSIYGLYSPAVVSVSMTALAEGVPDSSTVIFTLDGIKIWTATRSPYYLGKVSSGIPQGLDLTPFGFGEHQLSVCALLPTRKILVSDPISLTIIPSINTKFTATLGPYPNQGTAQQFSLEALLARTSTPGARLTDDEMAIRRKILAMYVDWGIDPSFDFANDQSAALVSLFPKGAGKTKTPREGTALSMHFSPDAAFYHSIPGQWPRVALPPGYIHGVQLNTAYQGDGIGFGQVVASAADPVLPVRSQWYDVAGTLRRFNFRMPADWSTHLPTQEAGDRHLVFIDPVANTFISSYKTSRDPLTGGPNALYISDPHTIAGLGDTGGSNAAGFADLPVMIQPGEATNAAQEIPHAIGGAVSRTWAARVYPASNWDAGVRTSINSCTHKGFTNTGLIPYGGVIQLDPALDLSRRGLSLPAYRILRAMQVYGYYVMDFGCADFDIYTALNAAELDPYGGLWGNANGRGVQNEIQDVIASNILYVVPPLTKK